MSKEAENKKDGMHSIPNERKSEPPPHIEDDACRCVNVAHRNYPWSRLLDYKGEPCAQKEPFFCVPQCMFAITRLPAVTPWRYIHS